MSRSTQAGATGANGADSGADESDEWTTSDIGEATEALRRELEAAAEDASGAREIALERAQDLVDKMESVVKKTR